jgi:hypothetical protein
MRLLLALLSSLIFAPAAWALPGPPALTVEVATVAQGSIPQGAQRVGMLTVSLAASCASDVSVASLDVRHSGLGSARDLARLYLMEGDRRVSRAAVPNDKAPTTLRLRSFTVPACETRILTVAADVSASAAAAGEHRLSVEEVRADAPARILSAASSSSAPRATVTPNASASTVAVEFLPVHTSVSYGANRTLARLRLQNDGRRAQSVSAIMFTNDGSARDADLQDLALYSSAGDRVSAVAAALDGSILRLELDPALVLDSRDEKVLELRGDVRASRKRTIEFAIEEPSDVEAAEARTR